MKLNQRMKDLVLLVKRDRKYQLVAAAFVVTIALVMSGTLGSRGGSGAPKKVKKSKEHTSPLELSGSSKSEPYTDLVTRFQRDNDQLATQVRELIKRQAETEASQKQFQETSAEIFKKLINRAADFEDKMNRPGVNGAAMTAGGPQVDMNGEPDPTALAGGMASLGGGGLDTLEGNSGNVGELEKFGEDAIAPVALAAKSGPAKVAVVGPGDSVRVKLLSGVNAPTDQTPYPVVFKLIGDIQGPDGSSLPLGEARLVAAAQGSLSDSRALFRLTSLNLRFPNGRRKIIDVDGWVVGEDGLRGMEGVLLDPLGKEIAAAGLVGGLDGWARAFSQARIKVDRNAYGTQTTTIDGSETDYAAGQAVSGASREWANLIQKRTDELVPHVQVLANREGTAIFAKAFKIPELYEALSVEQDVFSSLD